MSQHCPDFNFPALCKERKHFIYTCRQIKDIKFTTLIFWCALINRTGHRHLFPAEKKSKVWIYSSTKISNVAGCGCIPDSVIILEHLTTEHLNFNEKIEITSLFLAIIGRVNLFLQPPCNMCIFILCKNSNT